MEENYIEHKGVLVPKSKMSFSLNTNTLDNIRKQQEEDLKKDVIEVRKKLTLITDSIYLRSDQAQYRQGMEIERKVAKEHFYSSRCFFIPNFEYAYEVFGDYIYDKSLGLLSDFNNPIFGGRFVYPILGFNGEVIGFIGYDRDHEIKYLLSRTYGFGKFNTFYGMHMMRWIYSKGYIVVQEGIVDCYPLWEAGIPAISLNGNSMSDFIVKILKRFGYNVIFIPDNDEAGRESLPYWRRQVPDASTIILTTCKDTDEFRKVYGMVPIENAIKRCLASASISTPTEVILTI